MNTNRVNFAIGGFVALAILALLSSFMFYPSQETSAATFNATILNAATTTAAVTVTSSTQVLATSTKDVYGVITGFTRVYATICNPSTTLVYVNMNADKPASATKAAVFIAAAAGYNACFEITDRNLYQGGVQASSTNQTS